MVETQQDRTKAGPRLHLPPTIGDALDAIAGPEGSDRRWFEQHPDRRWRIRPSEPVEHQVHELVALMLADGIDGHTCSTCTPYTLVTASPSLNIRFRHFVANCFAEPVGWVAEAVATETDVDFLKAYAPHLRGRGVPA